MPRAGVLHNRWELVRLLSVDPVDSLAKAAEHKKVKPRDTEGQISVSPCCSLHGDVPNDGGGSLFSEKLRERRVFGQHMQRVANSATDRVAKQRRHRCRPGQAYAYRIIDALLANAPQPPHNRLGRKTKLRNDGKLQSGASGELHFGRQRLMQNRIRNVRVSLRKPGYGDAADPLVLKDPGL